MRMVISYLYTYYSRLLLFSGKPANIKLLTILNCVSAHDSLCVIAIVAQAAAVAFRAAASSSADFTIAAAAAELLLLHYYQ